MADQNTQSLLLGKIAAYTEILVKDSSSTIFVSLAETYRKMGMFDDARQIISKGLNLHPDFSPAYIVLARVLCQLEDFNGSVDAFEKALEFDGESLAALVGYARVQILLGEEEQARELLLKARELTPADPVINKLLLSLPDFEELNEAEGGGDVNTQEGSGSDSSSLVSSTLADLYLAQGLPEKALDLFQRLSIQNPDDLTLRRKIKELDKKIEEDNNFLGTKGDDLEGSQFEDTIPIPDASQMIDGEDTEVDEVVSDEDPLEKVTKTFDYWLANIQRRRGHV